ncbi:hypothetical protein [Secundilactobacillus collinoides]|uniref:hypothetical protein n=1 Tax=Secundilactobacillus collinoides TaxID=33960 RepID=UPI000AE2C60B|nr:hypothetical protein [Secundilactobacillus collinoides]
MAGVLPVRPHGGFEETGSTGSQDLSGQAKQTVETISRLLADAFANGSVVSIQLNNLDSNGDYHPDVVGRLAGYQDDMIYMNEKAPMMISEIRHVIVDPA